ncbi:hypothetical protein ABZ816_27630 [Actinosynnema sp. NPDC047251]|uniref:Uncharacterized protein n=1 Tax=Saccharothrix espanaensis (strain ATCC 51144 / DSM 44229 / JCM 9112 / NBRC 15066 / NRRL 15764) TaxID=1179773 RepID=K0JSD5_SACES|nr:hypothetical protein [Saccharothrix espanaensis]CCH28776.1 hypothetical protein BN6_14530 [Saccharothrix espanaensis DSM 44229]
MRGFASGEFRHKLTRAGSVIREVARFLKRIGDVEHGTDIVGVVRRSYDGHDRVFIIPDMQTMSGRGRACRTRRRHPEIPD